MIARDEVRAVLVWFSMLTAIVGQDVFGLDTSFRGFRSALPNKGVGTPAPSNGTSPVPPR